jgi:hypothetical protein
MAALSHDEARVTRIRELNDAFRRAFAGRIFASDGVAALPDVVRNEAFVRVVTFSDFSENNDPHGEHDFGAFELCGRKFFWKIDYYDAAMEYGSEDPSDPEKTTRVLTLMLASEY